MKRRLATLLTAILAISVAQAADPNITISDGSWHDAGIWSAEFVPVDGQAVTVSNHVTLTNLTAALDSFTMSTGTLTFANAGTWLWATNVTITGGTVTHVSCGTNSATTNRVYIICSNLTLSAGARIDTDGMGYEGGGSNQDGFGPGGGFHSGGGAGHGGRGGDSDVSDRGATYGSGQSPLQAGSGGAAYRNDAIGGDGGGAIRIEADGRVVVNGTISGNGTKGGPLWGGIPGGGGSGGSVYITCDSIAGTGTISVNAGDAGAMTATAGGGGGGRIAIAYSPAAQSNETPALTISAVEGASGGSYAKRAEPSYGVPGTIHMTSTQLMHENLKGGQYLVPGATSWSVGNLSLTNGTVVLPTNIIVNVQTNLVTSGNGALQVSDVDLRVGSNVLVSASAQVRTTFTGGPKAKTVLGGNLVVSNAHFLVQGVSSNDTSLHVGGNLLLTDSGTMYVKAGITNAATLDYGALVSVTGTLTVAPSAVLYPYSDGTNGGSVLFRAAEVHVGTNAMIDADFIGFVGGPSGSDGHGPGRSLKGLNAGGAGYGGAGGNGAVTTGGLTYGDTNAPIHPGSSAGCYGGSIGGDGGGLVRMEATSEIQIDGTITANGEDGPGNWGGGYGGAGAGGGIYLRCATFTGIGRLRADGGNADPGGSAGGGGGGRITVWLTEHSWDGSPIPPHPTCSVTNGLAYNSGAPGETGTVYIAVDPWSPRINNLAAPNVDGTTADAVGDLISIGNAPTTVSVYWGRTNGFDVKGNWTTHDLIGPSGLGEITNHLSSLSTGTRYYYRFYATNAYGHDWGYPSASFATMGGIEVDNASGATDITLTSAQLRGEVLVGNPSPTATLYWGTSNGYENPAAWDNQIDAGLVTNWAFSGLATGLVANQTYFYNSYITNSAGEDWAPAATNFTTGMPEISIDDLDIVEGPDGNTTNAGFTVSLSGVSAIDVSVTFQTSNGTAQAEADYQSTSGTLVIPAGSSVGTIVVPVNGDNVDEFPSETFFILLDSPIDATILDGTGRCTIIDDDDVWQLKTWSGPGNWDSVTNWSPAGFPGPADTAVIPAGQSCTLTGSTFFATLTNSGTLTFSGTNALLSGTDVTINGIVTHLPQSATTTNIQGQWVIDHSLHIHCTNLTVTPTGRIDASQKGYKGALTSSQKGYGPGAGLAVSGGAGHGGIGGLATGGKTYGSSSAPGEPGSGGGSYSSWAIGGDGGGVIRVEVSGRILIDGSIAAEGSVGGPNYGGLGGGGGSGGSVWLTCHSIGGSGRVSANGGDGGYLEGQKQGGGGGGRVAIEYDETAQTTESQTPVISAAGGHSGGAYVLYSGAALGEPGTLCMPDAQLLGSTLDGGVFEIPGFTAWTVDSLLLTNGTVIFPDSFHLTVNGDVTTREWGALELTDAVLNVGGSMKLSSVPKVGTQITSGPNHASAIAGDCTLNGSALRLVGVSSNDTRLTINGDCLLTNGATFSIYSGITNAGTADYGALVEVQGRMTLAPTSWVYPHSDVTNGGSPMFQLGSLTVEAAAGFNANMYGYAGGAYSGDGRGPGGGIKGMDAGGGGYGGVGGNGDDAAGGAIYGDADRPLDPGSGGGSYGGSSGGDGGGLVRIAVPEGTVRVDGLLTANGGNGGGSYGGGYGGAGAGGGIHIICKNIDGSGGISADGGNADAGGNGGGGGGGRIAVYFGRDLTGGLVATNVVGGSGWVDGSSGTIVWAETAKKSTVIFIR